ITTTLSLHDALPICRGSQLAVPREVNPDVGQRFQRQAVEAGGFVHRHILSRIRVVAIARAHGEAGEEHEASGLNGLALKTLTHRSEEHTSELQSRFD